MSQHSSRNAKMALGKLMTALGASSLTLYVRDPLWDKELRLLYMRGVKVQEPMHGFLASKLVENLSNMEHDQVFLDYTTPDGKSARPLRHPMLAELSKTKVVYRDFVDREKITTCLKTRHRTNDRLNAALFLNFATQRDITYGERQAAREVLDQFVGEFLPAIQRQMENPRNFPLHSLIRFLTPLDGASSRLSHVSHVARTQAVFAELLAALFSAFGLSDADDAGAVYLLDEERKSLLLHTERGEAITLNSTQPLEQGAFGWVALTRLGLLISHISKSEYRTIYAGIGKDINSLIAVPIVVANELVGVVGLEAKRRSAFDPNDMRMMWYAASQAAMYHQLATEASSRRTIADQDNSLMSFLQAAQTKPQKDLMDEVACISARFVDATRCKIWKVPKDGQDWSLIGNYPLGKTGIQPPRTDGWSNVIVHNNCLVLHKHISNSLSFETDALIRQNGEYRRIDLASTPRSLNMESTHGITSQLGVPCRLGKDTVGIAWFNFEEDLDRLSGKISSWIDFFDLFVGLLIKYLEQSARDRDEEVVRVVAKEINEQYSDFRLECRGIHYHVEKSVAHAGELGGDFVSIVSHPNMDRCICIVGDAEGHGLGGALRMLPLVTAFRILAKDSGAPKHILEKMNELATLIPALRGTATCFSIEMDIHAGPRLFVTSVGHPPLIIKSKSETRPFPSQRESIHEAIAASGMIGAGGDIRVGQAIRQLYDDDIIVAYTDGIKEARNANGKLFGDNGVQSAVSEAGHTEVDIAKHVYKRAKAFAAEPLVDDAAVVALRIDMKEYCRYKGANFVIN